MERVEPHYSPSGGNGEQLNHSCLCLAHLEAGGEVGGGGGGGEVGRRGGGGGKGRGTLFRYTMPVIKLLLYS